LRNILPEEIATELKEKGSIEPKQFNHVTVLFTDFVNFTGISSQMTPTELVQEIHKNFTAFDAIMEKNGLEKIKTIGDAYMAVCGLPHERADHAQCAAKAALDIQQYMRQNGGKFHIRIGLNSGPVVAGVVGVKKYAYDIWGDTVNVASRMESNSEAGKVNISGTTYELIKNEFICEHRGKIQAKNKGEIDMYFVLNSKGSDS
jgi:adenylate cyclase